jgi:3-methyladenine DNA glycosylase AlkC
MPITAAGAINKDLVKRLGGRLEAVYPRFDRVGFVGAASASLQGEDVLARIAAVSHRLSLALPGHYPAAVRVVVGAAEHREPPISSWEAVILNHFIETHGLPHVSDSLDAMEVLTRYASCELALRPFLAWRDERTWERVKDWATSADPELRRLAASGTRPRLPWGMPVPGLQDQPERSIALLDLMSGDPEPSVRRAVADHVCDIAEDHPDLAVATARRWIKANGQEALEIAAHGLRRLVHRGHPGALDVLGFADEASLEVERFWCEPCLLGVAGAVELRAELRSTSTSPQRFALDYVVHYALEGGGSKQFRWGTVELAPGEARMIRKRHCSGDLRIRARQTGTPRVELKISGETLAEAELEASR